MFLLFIFFFQFNKAAMVEHLSGTNKSHFHVAVKRVREQSEEIQSQSKLIKLQSEKISNLKDKLDTMSKQPRFSGTLLWDFPNFNKILSKVKATNEILIKHFFAMDGYKLKVDLRLNGDNLIHNSISIYISIVSGPFDDALEWPMKAYISFSVIGVGKKDKNVNRFSTDANDEMQKTFLNPSLVPSNGTGFTNFILHKDIPKLLIDGKLVLKICVRPKKK